MMNPARPVGNVLSSGYRRCRAHQPTARGDRVHEHADLRGYEVVPDVAVNFHSGSGENQPRRFRDPPEPGGSHLTICRQLLYWLRFQ